MAVPERNANVVALFPLQETIWDKDGTGALAYGVVSFFSDPLFSVTKDVYQESDDPVTGEVTYVNLGSVLTLSGIGSFVDDNGSNFIPMLYPYEGSPTDTVVGDFEPYYITVYSSSGIFQFSTNDWPPNTFSQSGSSQAQEALTPNLITNPQFSVVSFTPDPTTDTYVYSVSGTESNPLAPGWTLETVGTATITVSQLSLSDSITSEAPYALRLEWSTGLTQLRVVQQLTNSPRIIAGGNASASLVVSSPTGDDIDVQIHYIAPAPNAVDVLIVDSDTTGTSTYTTINGTESIPATNAQDADGYVSFVIDIQSLASSSSLDITSAQLVAVESSSIVADYIEQTTQENLNGLMWYYEPQLAYKPIPSYTIGWEFGYNPCQQLGTSVSVSGLGDNLSRYIADQTIAFEATGNILNYQFNEQSGLSAQAIGGTTQFAIIQYLDAVPARELLEGNMAVQISNGYGYDDDLTGYVNLYYTQDASLPSMTTTGNLTSGDSLVATMVDGQPATFNGNWIQVPRSGLGDAPFNPAGGFNINSYIGWDARAIASSISPTYFAIVISFTALAEDTQVSIRYCSLVKGNIATQPAPMNKAQTLAALQYYYETSYDAGEIGTAATVANQLCFPMSSVNYNTAIAPVTYNWYASAAPFTIPLKTTKRTDAYTAVLYAPVSGDSGNVTFQSYTPTAQSPTNLAASTWTLVSGTNSVNGTLASTTNLASVTGITTATPSYSSSIAMHYVVDARFGVV